MPAAPNTATAPKSAAHQRAASAATAAVNQQRPSSPAAPPPRGSRLGAVKKGQLRSAYRYLFYGVEGVGKSSLAADAPTPIFLDIEGGADQLDVARYPFRDEPGGHVPKTYDEVLAAVDDLLANPNHGYQTVVVDTLDALEALVHKHVCELHKHNSIEDFGYGKGYQVALDEFRRLVAKLDTLKSQGVSVVILGHSFVKSFKNPEGEDYDRYQLRVHDKIGDFVKGRCDVVGFVHFDGGSAKLKADSSQTKRARGWFSGKRLVQLAREAAWDAKSRLALPAVIELAADHPWDAFGEAKERAEEHPIADLIAAELERIGSEEFVTAAGRPTSRAAVLQMVDTAPPDVLSRVLAGLRATEAANDAAAPIDTATQENK